MVITARGRILTWPARIVVSQAELGRAGVLLGLHIGEGVPTVQPVAANLKTNDLTMLTYCISLKSYLDVTHILVTLRRIIVRRRDSEERSVLSTRLSN